MNKRTSDFMWLQFGATADNASPTSAIDKAENARFELVSNAVERSVGMPKFNTRFRVDDTLFQNHTIVLRLLFFLYFHR